MPYRTVAIATAACLLGTGAAAQQRFEITGSTVAVYNLAGEITLEAGTGSAVTVEVTRGGADAGGLEIERGPLAGRETLRVVYPTEHLRFPGAGYRGASDLWVREDGTFGDGRDGRRRGDGRRVRISSRGDFEAFANLRVLVPQGQRVEVYLGVGRLSATNVRGDLHLDAAGADVTTSGTTGSLSVDVGSGHTSIRNAEGDLTIDTGSGEVDVSGARGDVVVIDTGSGRVTVSSVTTGDLNIDTGSGDVEVTGATARRVRLDTGSGSVSCELIANPEDVDVDTGSGGVTLTLPASYSATVDIDAGGRGIDVEFPIETRRFSRDHVVGTIGDGRGTLRVDAGSGGVRIVKGTAR